MISKGTARTFKNLGALSPVFLAGVQMHGLILGSRSALTTLPGALALLLGAASILAGKKAGSVILAAYMLAMYYGGAATDKVPLPAEMLIFSGLVIGLIGVFVLHGKDKESIGKQVMSFVDAGLACSFTRISGAAGMSFGALLWMFSMAEMSAFTVFNSADGILIMLLAWQTLKRQSWAAAGQIILAASNLALSRAGLSESMAVFGFFPSFLLLIYSLGFIGVIRLKASRRKGDGRQT